MLNLKNVKLGLGLKRISEFKILNNFYKINCRLIYNKKEEMEEFGNYYLFNYN
jgi:hypothetical protein